MLAKKAQRKIRRSVKRTEGLNGDPLILEVAGMQAYLAEATHINQAVISLIFGGVRRATPEQAAVLEAWMIKLGLPITRWDFLYGIDVEETLYDYARKRVAQYHHV